MTDLKEVIIVVAILGVIALGVWLKSRTEMTEKKMLFEVQKQLIDKLGSGAEVTQFLASEEGKQFFERLKPPVPPVSPGPSPTEVLFVMIWVATGVALLGGGFFIGAAFVDHRLIVPGALCATAGIGLLLGLFITHQLAKKWGIFRINRATPSQGS